MSSVVSRLRSLTRAVAGGKNVCGLWQDNWLEPSCEVVLFFAEDSPNPQVKQAMKRARKVRKAARSSAAPSSVKITPRVS